MTTNSVAYNNRNLFFHNSGSKKARIKVPARLVPSGGLQGSTRSVLPSQLLEVTSHPWHFLACSYMTPNSASVVTWPSSPYVSLCFTWHSPLCVCVQTSLRVLDWSHLNDLNLPRLHLQRPLSQIRSHSQVPGVRISTSLLGGRNADNNRWWIC